MDHPTSDEQLPVQPQGAALPQVQATATKDCGHPKGHWCACRKYDDLYRSEQDADPYRDMG